MEQIIKILQNILYNLPLIAEEGEYREKISRNELCRILKEQTLVSNDAIKAVVELVELQWAKAGLLDPFELELGNWQFISFPASLGARSWLEVMTDKDGVWFPSGWWADLANTETHRELLLKLEQFLLKGNSSGDPHPIRQVYVAWGLIKLDEHLLFLEREDRTREGIPHFVLPGGRLNIHDLSSNLKGLDSSEYLKILQSVSSQKAIDSLPQALKRELEEELELENSEYSIGESFNLDPYMKLEGAGANHAYTCYEISLFPISLNLEGFNRLARMNQPISHNWFTLQEAAIAQKGDKRAFIDAWQEHHGRDKEKLLNQLNELPESFEDSFHFSEMVDIPIELGDSFKCGPTGSNERPCFVDLDHDELEILLAMAWHRLHGKNFPLKSRKSVYLSLSGWIEVKDKELLELLKSLQLKLNDSELPLIESYDRNWFRLSVPRENLFFNGEFFTYNLIKPRPDRWDLQLFTEVRDSKMGKLPKIVFTYPLHAENMYLYLKSVENGEEDEEIYSDQNNMMRNHLDPLCKQAGLRKLVRTSSGSREIICSPNNP